jgi:DNA-directed RNA polymerase subunit RPC12/RpoP
MAVTGKIGSVTKNIGGRISAAVETQKLTAKISAEKAAVEGLCKKLGELYYRQYKTGAETPEGAAAMRDLCAQIDAHNAAIDGAKADIDRINAKAEAEAPAPAGAPGAAPGAGAGAACPSCGTANAPGTKFCSECGAKLPEQAAAPAPGTCPACGSVNAPERKFCRDCGAKLT